MESASLSLAFIVVGGSISGLSCAYALCIAGHRVIILEKRDEKTKTEGSIRCPPNMTRILSEWPGIPALFDSHATKCSGISFRHGKNAEPAGFMKFHEEIMSELGADFLIMKHDDLSRHLISLCSDAGVVLKYGCEAVDFTSTHDSVDVTLKDGKKLRGDIVIGADGYHSIVRSIVAEDILECKHTVTGADISISTAIIQQYAALESLCEENQLTIWMGSGSAVVGTLDPKFETFNLSICFPEALEIPRSDGDWCPDGSRSVPFDLSGYDARLQKLLQLGHISCTTVHRVFDQDDLVGLDGRAILVGDAAHSALIHGSHNSSMAIEDAITIGRLFSRLSNRKQIPVLLNAYHEIRHPRTTATQDSEYHSLVHIALPPGKLQEARDATFKITLDKAFEDFENCHTSQSLVQTWEKYLVLFSHNAGEEVDNWWSMWGSTFEEIV